MVIPKAALLQVRGDWEYLIQCFRFRSVSSHQFCWLCDASKEVGHNHYIDFARDAAHRSTLFGHSEYLRRCAAEQAQPSFLFRIPGLQLKHVCVDSMHCADLGTFADALGSLFFMEIDCKLWYRNRALGLKHLNDELDKFYSAHQVDSLARVSPIKMTQIISSDPGYPFLKAKAAQTRHLAKFGLALAHRHRSGDSAFLPFCFPSGHHLEPVCNEYLEHLVKMFEGLATYCDSLMETPFSEQKCKDAMYQYLQALEVLHKLFRRVPGPHANLPFNVRPKAHMCQHLVEETVPVHGTPAGFWCYRDEDFVGLVKYIASKTKHPFTLAHRVLQKLRIFLFFESE